MLEITVISGKGGTGKTSLTGAFAQLAANHVICDLDVDAPDLHLLLDPAHERVEKFISGHEPLIDLEKCTDCGECERLCRYGAVKRNADGPFIDVIACESCKVCVHFCPAGAIEWNRRQCGEWYISRTRFGPMVHAQLFPGQENSGLLVTLLRNEARQLAEARGLDLILSDGSPGIGCPVISSLAGTDLAVIVTEPTPSGIHDMERVADLCAHFRVAAAVLVNKWDLNVEQTRAIETICQNKGLALVGRLPYDPVFTEAMVQRQVVTEYGRSPLAEEVRSTWARIMDIARLKQQAA